MTLLSGGVQQPVAQFNLTIIFIYIKPFLEKLNSFIELKMNKLVMIFLN